MAKMNPSPPASAVVTRRAVPGDARVVSQLYDRAYTTDQCKAKDQYPFPQVLETDWVADAISGSSIAWVVAELRGLIVGSAASVRNIGGVRDRIAEVFGVVVSEGARRKGVATALLGFLCAELARETEFILCESRTA